MAEDQSSQRKANDEVIAVSDEALQKAEAFVEAEEGAANRLMGWAGRISTAIAVAMSLFHLYAAYETPPPSPPPDTGASWYPILTGPTSDDGQGTFTFKVSIVGGPPGGPLTTSVVLQAYKAQLANVYPNYQPIPGHGLPGVSGDWHSGNGQGVLLVPGSIEEGVARITFRGPKPAAPIYVGFAINRTGTTHGFSNNIVFDPWAGVPEGGVL